MKYAYYPGCSSEGSGAEYAHASEAVLEALGVELEEIDDWVCCGASPAHATSHLLSIALPAISCAAAEKQSLDIMTCCACCHSRLKQTNQQVKDDPELRAPTVSFIPTGKSIDGVIETLTAHKLMAGSGHFYAVRPLEGMAIPTETGVVRLSFVHYTTMAEIEQLIGGLEAALN